MEDTTFTWEFRVNLLGRLGKAEGDGGFVTIKITISGSSNLFRDFTATAGTFQLFNSLSHSLTGKLLTFAKSSLL